MDHAYRASIDDVTICPMTQEDSEKYRVLRNELGSRECFFQAVEISFEQQKQWYEKYLGRAREYMFSIRSAECFVGGCGIYNVNEKENSAEFGRILIGVKYRKGGIGVKATKAAVNIAQNFLRLKRLVLYVKENNLPAIRTYQNAGFKIFGKDDGIVEMFIDL